MSLLTRFAKAFTAEDRGADEPSGLIEDQQGRVYYIKPDGTRVEVGGGGGSLPVNWCRVALTPAAPLTVTASYYDFTVDDITITAQAGSDFTVGTSYEDADGSIISAGGGVFQSSLFIDARSIGGTLDGGSTIQRYVSYGLSMGPLDGSVSISPVGIDAFIPVLGTDGSVYLTRTGVSTPGYIAPGAPVTGGMFASLANGFGTDSLSVAGIILCVWQIGTT